MAPYLLLGFFMAGLLSILIKQALIERWLGKRTLGSVIKASLLGIPLPLCSCGVIPVTSSLYKRGASKGATVSFLTSTPQTGVDSMLASGVSPGAALVFLIAGPATNIATITTLLKILGRRTIAIHLLSIIGISWLSGWLLDVFGGSIIIETLAHHHQSTGHSLLQISSGLCLICMIIWAYVFPKIRKTPSSNSMKDSTISTLRVDGMTCSHCASHVSEALLKVPGVTSANADASQNLAWVKGENLDLEKMGDAIQEAGYEFQGLA